MRTIIFSIISLCSIAIVSFVQAEKINDLTIDTYVTDYANMISENTQSQLEQQLSQFAQETSHQILVITVNDIDGDYIEHYSIKLAEKIKAGTAKYDNGAILLISKNDRQLRIEVGYGLESVVTDGISNNIISDILVPAFQQGKVDEGVTTAVDQLMRAAKGEVLPIDPSSNQSSGQNIILILYGVLFGLVRLGTILSRTKERWLGGIIGAACGVCIIVIAGFTLGYVFMGLGITVFGFIFDYIVSKDYKRYQAGVSRPARWTGGTRGPGGGSWGGGGSSRGGGFSGGGGSFGGGGASGRW